MKKVSLWCICILFILMAAPSFCGELKVIKYSDAALTRALSDNMPIALWFTDDDNYDCRLMEQNMLDNGQFVAAVEDLIWMKIDLTGPANRARYRDLCTEYNVTKLPSIIYLNADGREYKNTRTSGYTNSDDILAALIAGAVIGWLINDNWYDDYYYNNRIVYRNNDWWRYSDRWIWFDDRYYYNDRYRHYRHPDYIFPSRIPDFPGEVRRPPLPPAMDGRKPGTGSHHPLPDVMQPRPNIAVPRPNIAEPRPNIARPRPIIGRPGDNRPERPDVRRPERPSRPDVSERPSFPASRPSVTRQESKPVTKPSAPPRERPKTDKRSK